MIRVCYFLVLSMMIVVACDDGSSSDPNDTETEEPVDTGTGDTGTETEPGDTDTGESEEPPELPANCSVQLNHQEVSGTGNGQWPAARYTGQSAMIGFAYDSQEGTNSKWLVHTGIVAEPISTIDLLTPMSTPVIAQKTNMGEFGGTTAMVWLEGRSDWDPFCIDSGPEDCELDVAFMTFGANSIPDADEPIRITSIGGLSGRPAVVGTDSGWIVVWSENVGTYEATIMGVSVSEDGTVGTPVQLSATGGANDPTSLSAAGIGNTVIVMWLSESQHGIEYRVLTPDAALVGDVRILDEGVHLFYPNVVSGNGEFLTSYGRKSYEDVEIYTRKIDLNGTAAAQMERITWLESDAQESIVAYNEEGGYAIIWTAESENGSTACMDDICNLKTFGASLDSNGALNSVPVFLSVGNDDLNPCSDLALSWTGARWIGLWQTRRNFRERIYYGVFSCL